MVYEPVESEVTVTEKVRWKPCFAEQQVKK